MQEIIAAIIVVVAGAYVARAAGRMLFGTVSCGSGCGTCAAPVDGDVAGRIPLSMR